MNDSFIDLAALRVFLSIAQEHNMSTAGARLGITQSAVSQALRALENQLGTVLVNRSDRPLTLTPAGRLLTERGSTLMDGAVDLRRAVIGVGQGAHPSLRLGLVDSFASTCGAALASQYVQAGTRLSLRTGLSPDLGRGLLSREFDLVISSDGLHEVDNVDRHELLSEGYLVITPRNLAMKIDTVLDLRKLADAQPMIRFNRQSHLGAQIDHVIRRHGIQAGRHLEVDTSDTLTSMVGTGRLGWALTTPMCLLQAEHLAKTVDAHIVGDLVGARSLFLLALKDQHRQVVQHARQAICDLLTGDAIPRLAAIHPGLASLLRLGSAADLPADFP